MNLQNQLLILKKLIEMYDKGLLTDEEFIAMKKKIN